MIRDTPNTRESHRFALKVARTTRKLHFVLSLMFVFIRLNFRLGKMSNLGNHASCDIPSDRAFVLPCLRSGARCSPH